MAPVLRAVLPGAGLWAAWAAAPLSCEAGPAESGAPGRRDAGAASGGASAVTAPPGTVGWSWSTPRPQGNPLLAVIAAGPLHLLAVGRGGTVLRSASGGESWSVVASGTERDLAAIWAAAGASAWAVGAGGTVLHSADAGRSWEPRSAGTREDLTGVWSAGGGHVIVVGHKGTVLRSTDRGRTWESDEADVQDDLLGLWGRARDDVWAV